MPRFHEHIVEDDVPECTTIKEFKCEQKTRGYTTEEVRCQNLIPNNSHDETGCARFTRPLTKFCHT